MKRILVLYQRYILTSMLLTLCVSLMAQNRTAFTSRAQENRSQQIRATLTSSDTITLEGMGTIYSLSIDATICQPREASFTRIVLEDTEGHDYLVAESDWFRFDSTTVNLDHYCEETALLKGIHPFRLKCYVSGDATLSLSAIHASDHISARKAGSPKETAESIKLAQVQDIVERINVSNEKHKRLWEAGITNNSLVKYNEIRDENDTYLTNIKYYKAGIFEFGERDSTIYRYDSPYPTCFDWRNIHGMRKQFITPVKNQDPTNWCVTFAAVAAIEAKTNLFFNDTINLNLSEVSVAYYMKNTTDIEEIKAGTTPPVPLSYIQNNGVLDNETMPFVTDTMQLYYGQPPIRPEGIENVRFTSYDHVPRSTGSDASIDIIKGTIINKGPCLGGFKRPDYPTSGHEMMLIGYEAISPDTFYIVTLPWNVERWVSEETDPQWIGKTCWIFKDSYYGACNHGHEGYMYLIYNDYYYMNPVYYINTPIIRRGHNEQEIIVEDYDGDGYYNWGIGSKPSHCPAWAPDLSDGDDSDRLKGHMNEYGYCEELSLSRPMYQYIANDSTLTQPESRSSYLGILRGATVTLQTQLTFENGTQLLLDNGATLIINGITINGSYIRPYPGSKVVLNNGAKIQKPFEVPLGVELVINSGSIE